MKHYDIEKAKEFFAAKAAFSTGLYEVDGMIKGGEDIVVVDVRKPRLLMLWESTGQGLCCSWRQHPSKAPPIFGRTRVDSHERNRRWRVALGGRAT